VAFNFMIVAPFLKFNISAMCRYKIIKQKVSKRPDIEFMDLYFYLYIWYIKVCVYIY
jgi:hypothetical protein